MANKGTGNEPNLQEQVDLLRQQLCPGAKADRVGRTGRHHHARIQQRGDDDPSITPKMGMRHKDAQTRDKCFDKIFALGHSRGRRSPTLFWAWRATARPARNQPI